MQAHPWPVAVKSAATLTCAAIRRLSPLACAAALPLLLTTTSCDSEFDPSSMVQTLRVLAVKTDKPYPKPGTKVSFDMLWHDGKSPPDEPRKVQFLWLGGCFNPPGDLYAGCFEQIAKVFAAGPGDPSVAKYVGTGQTFSLDLPEDLISSRPTKPDITPYGLSYVFFFVCAGTLKPIQPPDPDKFPIGCFDDAGRELGADDFVPGYLSLYSYDDRTNQNPIVTGMAIAGQPTEEAPDTVIRGCRSGDCPSVDVKALIDPASAEPDPGAVDPNGNQLLEQMWVSYYSTDGKLEKAARLVNDATKGWNNDNNVKFSPPAPGKKLYLYAVVRDNRGGTAWVKRGVKTE